MSTITIQKAPPFVMIRKDLLKDYWWKQLTNSAKILYIYLRSKFNHRTLSEVTLTYSEMAGIMSSRTMSRAFKELEKWGFIVKSKQGGKHGGACRYRFTGPFKDFYYNGRAV